MENEEEEVKEWEEEEKDKKRKRKREERGVINERWRITKDKESRGGDLCVCVC